MAKCSPGCSRKGKRAATECRSRISVDPVDDCQSVYDVSACSCSESVSRRRPPCRAPEQDDTSDVSTLSSVFLTASNDPTRGKICPGLGQASDDDDKGNACSSLGLSGYGKGRGGVETYSRDPTVCAYSHPPDLDKVDQADAIVQTSLTTSKDPGSTSEGLTTTWSADVSMTGKETSRSKTEPSAPSKEKSVTFQSSGVKSDDSTRSTSDKKSKSDSSSRSTKGRELKSQETSQSNVMTPSDQEASSQPPAETSQSEVTADTQEETSSSRRNKCSPSRAPTPCPYPAVCSRYTSGNRSPCRADLGASKCQTRQENQTSRCRKQNEPESIPQESEFTETDEEMKESEETTQDVKEREIEEPRRVVEDESKCCTPKPSSCPFTSCARPTCGQNYLPTGPTRCGESCNVKCGTGKQPVNRQQVDTQEETVQEAVLAKETRGEPESDVEDSEADQKSCTSSDYPKVCGKYCSPRYLTKRREVDDRCKCGPPKEKKPNDSKKREKPPKGVPIAVSSELDQDTTEEKDISRHNASGDEEEDEVTSPPPQKTDGAESPQEDVAADETEPKPKVDTGKVTCCPIPALGCLPCPLPLSPALTPRSRSCFIFSPRSEWLASVMGRPCLYDCCPRPFLCASGCGPSCCCLTTRPCWEPPVCGMGQPPLAACYLDLCLPRRPCCPQKRSYLERLCCPDKLCCPERVCPPKTLCCPDKLCCPERVCSPKTLCCPVGVCSSERAFFPEKLSFPDKLCCPERVCSPKRVSFPVGVCSSERAFFPEKLSFPDKLCCLERVCSPKRPCCPEKVCCPERLSSPKRLFCSEKVCSSERRSCNIRSSEKCCTRPGYTAENSMLGRWRRDVQSSSDQRCCIHRTASGKK